MVVQNDFDFVLSAYESKDRILIMQRLQLIPNNCPLVIKFFLSDIKKTPKMLWPTIPVDDSISTIRFLLPKWNSVR